MLFYSSPSFVSGRQGISKGKQQVGLEASKPATKSKQASKQPASVTQETPPDDNAAERCHHNTGHHHHQNEAHSFCLVAGELDEKSTSWWRRKQLLSEQAEVLRARELHDGRQPLTASDEQQLEQSAETQLEASGTNLPTICGQLLTLVCGLLLLLYLIDFIQRQMTNLFTKILGGANEQRRRSLASNSGSSSSSSTVQQQHQHQRHQLPGGQLVAQSELSQSSLCLPTVGTQQNAHLVGRQQALASQQDKSATLTSASSSVRRTSRSSIQSLFSAFTGVISSQQQQSNNGRSMVAKNKEGAENASIASSPTIIQKEASDASSSGVGASLVSVNSSGLVGGAANAGGSGAGVTPTGMGVASPSPIGPLSPLASLITSSGQPAPPNEAAELVLADQSLFDTLRNPLGVSNSLANVLALAAAAAIEPQPSGATSGAGQTGAPSHHLGSLAAFQLPSVSTQVAGSAPSGSEQLHHHAAAHGHLSSSSTIKQAGGGPGSPAGSCANGVGSAPQQSPRKGSASAANAAGSSSPAAKRMEIIKLTELVLNALNQGDYDTFTRLCDPHMTSFEPDNLGNLVDNMEYRRLCIDQARQLQIHHHIQRNRGTASGHQLEASVAVAAAAAAAAAAVASSDPSASEVHKQRVQAAALTAARSALANMSLNGTGADPISRAGSGQMTSAKATGAQQLNELALGEPAGAYLHTSCASLRQYSLVLNPNVYLIGEDAATIAYTKLSHLLNLATGQLCATEQAEETRVWHRRDGKRWVCVHLHRSLAAGNAASGALAACTGLQSSGPQTSLSLLRSVVQQQQIANLMALQQMQTQQHQVVPLISLSAQQSNPSQQQQQ